MPEKRAEKQLHLWIFLIVAVASFASLVWMNLPEQYVGYQVLEPPQFFEAGKPFTISGNKIFFVDFSKKIYSSTPIENPDIAITYFSLSTFISPQELQNPVSTKTVYYYVAIEGAKAIDQLASPKGANLEGTLDDDARDYNSQFSSITATDCRTKLQQRLNSLNSGLSIPKSMQIASTYYSLPASRSMETKNLCILTKDDRIVKLHLTRPFVLSSFNFEWQDLGPMVEPTPTQISIISPIPMPTSTQVPISSPTPTPTPVVLNLVTDMYFRSVQGASCTPGYELKGSFVSSDPYSMSTPPNLAWGWFNFCVKKSETSNDPMVTSTVLYRDPYSQCPQGYAVSPLSGQAIESASGGWNYKLAETEVDDCFKYNDFYFCPISRGISTALCMQSFPRTADKIPSALLDAYLSESDTCTEGYSELPIQQFENYNLDKQLKGVADCRSQSKDGCLRRQFLCIKTVGMTATQSPTPTQPLTPSPSPTPTPIPSLTSTPYPQISGGLAVCETSLEGIVDVFTIETIRGNVENYCVGNDPPILGAYPILGEVGGRPLTPIDKQMIIQNKNLLLQSGSGVYTDANQKTVLRCNVPCSISGAEKIRKCKAYFSGPAEEPLTADPLSVCPSASPTESPTPAPTEAPTPTPIPTPTPTPAPPAFDLNVCLTNCPTDQITVCETDCAGLSTARQISRCNAQCMRTGVKTCRAVCRAQS